MASENEASCESDPNFAVICGFLEKFGVTCGLANIDFVDLQEMIENTQEVSQELIELHIKLMRRARKSVSSNERWERALIKTCHTFSSQDAWEIERFGYKKARIGSKLRILKELLEMQFDYNQKFKNEINKMSATELRTQPLGRDRVGRAYWYQCDESCQIRVYKDDPDDETWMLVAKDRDGLVSLISQLGNGDTTKCSSEPVSNEDSNSLEIEKPTLDTGQSKDLLSNSEMNSDNTQVDDKMEIESESMVKNGEDIEESKSDDLPEAVETNHDEDETRENTDKNETEADKNDNNETDEKSEVTNEECNNVVESSKENNNEDQKDTENEADNKEETIEETCEDALNLCSKDLSNKDNTKEEKSCLDLSVKSAPCLRIKPLTELMAQPQHLEMQKKEFMGIKGKYIRSDGMDKGLLYPNPTHLGKAVQSASYDAICYKRAMEEDIYAVPTSLKQPRFDRPTLLGNKKYMTYVNDEDDEDEEEDDDEELDDEIEEPLMLVQGEGSGFLNESVNDTSEESPIVGDEIQEAVFHVSGEGNGEDCETGNKCLDGSEDEKIKESNNPNTSGKKGESPLENQISSNEVSLENSNNVDETLSDAIKNDKTSVKLADLPETSPESSDGVSSPVKQTFFFGNSFSPNTSPIKRASLSFGASTVADNLNVNPQSISSVTPTIDEHHVVVEGSKIAEKTDQNLIGSTPSNTTKVPDNVDIEIIDNNKDISESLFDNVSKESEHGHQECDKTLINPSDSNASETNKDTVDSGRILEAAEAKLTVNQDEKPEAYCKNPEINKIENVSSPSESSRSNKCEAQHDESNSDTDVPTVISQSGSATELEIPEILNEHTQADTAVDDCQVLETDSITKKPEEMSNIEEKALSTAIGEEPTTVDETKSDISANSTENESEQLEARNDRNMVPDPCIKGNTVTAVETVESSDDESNSNFDGFIDNCVSSDDDDDDPEILTSTTDKKELKEEGINCETKEGVESKKDDTDIVPLEMKINENLIEDTENKNCVDGKEESSFLEEKVERKRCESTNIICEEDPKESVEEINKDQTNSSEAGEINDLSPNKDHNEVDSKDSTKTNSEKSDTKTHVEIDISTLTDENVKIDSSDSDQGHLDVASENEETDTDNSKQSVEKKNNDNEIEINIANTIHRDEPIDSSSTAKDAETSLENESNEVDEGVKESDIQVTTTTQFDKEENEHLKTTSDDVAVEPITPTDIVLDPLSEEDAEDLKEQSDDVKDNTIRASPEQNQEVKIKACCVELEVITMEKHGKSKYIREENKDPDCIKTKHITTEKSDKDADQIQNSLDDDLPLETGIDEQDPKEDNNAFQDDKELKSETENEKQKSIAKEPIIIGDLEEELGTVSDTNDEQIPAAITAPSSNVDNKESPPVIEADEDIGDNRCGIAAIKAIKITSVQAKCEILDTVEDIPMSIDKKQEEKLENVTVKKQNTFQEKPSEHQPLRFLRGRRPNQMLSVKSYATRNKNLVLRKEIKPSVETNEKNNRNKEKILSDNEVPLLNAIKIEENVENIVRRSTRRKPGDPQDKTPEIHLDAVQADIGKKAKGRPRKIAQVQQQIKQEQTDVRYSKRLRLSNNQIPPATDVETIDLTAETECRKISVKNCNENVHVKEEMVTKETDKDEKKSSKLNGPFLSCVNIQKLKENPIDHVESPLSVESSGGGDTSDVVIIEDDPLAVSTLYQSTNVKTMTLNSFQLDVDYSSPSPMVMTRSLRKRGRPEPEISLPSAGKRRKMKGKRQVDLELRRSIEEQKQQEASSSDEEKVDDSPKRKPQPYKKKEVEIHFDAPPVERVKKPRAPRKKTLLGLDVPDVMEELTANIGNVRQSRRIAQLKIKEEAERRKLDDITMTDDKESKKKAKKDIDKDYKAEKRKRTKPPTEEEITVDVPEVEEKKKKRKRKRKHKDPRKIFDESNPWRSSSGSSSSNDDVEEEEEEIVEYSEAESPLFKSDHEFSPESDIEDVEEPQPLKRARTARKEDDIEDDVDDHACQKCGKSDHPEWILLCDGCDNGWHCSCLRPALFIIPEGDWFCPPCQHNTLVKQLEEKLVEFDKKLAKREIEERRKERLAYVGISLANVLPVKDGDEKRRKKDKSDDDEEEEESVSEDSSSSSESSSSSDSDEPIYQLRQRRQAHSYRFNDYDELINSAIQEEMDAVKGAGNQGRGKDISTIVNAEKEELAEKEKQEEEEKELPPPVVPVETKELPPAVIPPEHNDSDEDKIKPVKKFIGRKKQRKLNSLDVSSGDDPDSDEDFKGSSSDEEDDDDFEEDMGSDSSEVYRGRRRKGVPVRRSTRARTSRYDKDFINDNSDEEDVPRKKKSRSVWNESDTEESDISWKWSSRRKPARNTTSFRKKRSKKSKKHFEDSDEDRSKKKKRRIKYGGLNDDDEEETAGRRTRGKKINYADVLASDSDDEIKRKAPPRIESDDDYVANEDQEDPEDEDFEKEESVEKEEPTVKEKTTKEADKTPPTIASPEPEVQTQPTEVVPPILPQDEPVLPALNDSESIPPENFDLDNLNSSIDDLPDDIADENDDDDAELNPIDEINKNLEEMDEAEMEKLMEEEEYANKQLQLVAMQLEKQKKRKQKEAKKKEIPVALDSKGSKKRGKKNKPEDDPSDANVIQIGTLQVGPDMQTNAELSEPPGVTIPIFGELSPSTTMDGSPKKRRGRGKGKKTLEKEAAAAAAAAAATGGSVVNTNPPTTPSSVVSGTVDEQSHIPTTVDTVANVNSDDMALANAAAMHGAKLAIAAPPQPFSQTQPTPSVITRMLQGQPGQGNYSPLGMGHNFYADQPPSHVENSPTPPVSNAQMATCVPVSNNMTVNHNSTGQLPPMSQPQQQYMHGAPTPRGMSSTIYRQPPPNVNPYHRTSPAPPIPQIRVRNPTPSIPPVYHSHHPLDPSPSGGGPINVPTSAMNTPDRSSPISMPPSSDSPLSNKSDPTPPPPPYSRPQMRFTNVNTSPMASSPIRQQPNLLPPQQHIQQQPSPLRNNMPYHPANMPSNYYGGFMSSSGNMGPEETLPSSGYHYSDQFSETNSPQDIGKSYDEENSGEFGGLVSYFSSQREDDLDT